MPNLVTNPQAGTVRKAKAATWAAGLAGLAVPYLLAVIGLELPDEAAAGLTELLALVLSAAAMAVTTWASAYLTRPSPEDVPVVEGTNRVPIPANLTPGPPTT